MQPWLWNCSSKKSLVYPIPPQSLPPSTVSGWHQTGAWPRHHWSRCRDRSGLEPPPHARRGSSRGPAAPEVTFCGCAVSVPAAAGEHPSWILPRWKRRGWRNLEAERLLRSLRPHSELTWGNGRFRIPRSPAGTTRASSHSPAWPFRRPQPKGTTRPISSPRPKHQLLPYRRKRRLLRSSRQECWVSQRKGCCFRSPLLPGRVCFARRWAQEFLESNTPP